MKKRKIIIAVVCAVILWITVGIVDFSLVHSFRSPVFCVCSEPMQDGGSGKYVGLGYSFDIKGDYMPEDKLPGIIKWIYYLFRVEIQTRIRG